MKKEEGPYDTPVVIRGTDEQCQKAEELIKELVEETPLVCKCSRHFFAVACFVMILVTENGTSATMMVFCHPSLFWNGNQTGF